MQTPVQNAGLPVLTDEQQNAISYAKANFRSGVIAISGPAGSGKTTLIKSLEEALPQQVTIAAMTNKAAHVLRTKGIPDALTLHQACMRPRFRPPMDRLGTFLEQGPLVDTTEEYLIEWPMSLIREFGRDRLTGALHTSNNKGIYAAFRELGINDVMKYVEGWLPKDAAAGILIIDEASMLGPNELKTATEVYRQIILVGDEHQLPPIKGDPVFWEIENRVALTQIHRQAEGSQPLKLATALRTGGSVVPDPLEAINVELSRAGYPVIVWRNKTREELTAAIRERIGYAGMPPQAGEVLICRNVSDRAAKARGLINNSLWRVVEANGYECTLENDLGDVHKRVHVHMEELSSGWGIPFRFAYALTCHSAQGSQWDEVMIHQPDANAFCAASPAESRKWLYTALTRAAKRVHWVTSKVV